MKKIGKQVLFLETSNSILRNGEGSFIRLKDGKIMYAYTEYFGSVRSDTSPANIVAVYSSDEGETWQNKRIIVSKRENDFI